MKKFDSNLEKYICFGIKSDIFNINFKIGLITNVKPCETSMEYDKCPFEMSYIKSGGKSITNIYISDNTGDWYRESSCIIISQFIFFICKSDLRMILFIVNPQILTFYQPKVWKYVEYLFTQ